MEVQLKQYQVLGLQLLFQNKQRADFALNQALIDLGLDPAKDYEITEYNNAIREVQRAPNDLPH